MKNDKKSSKTPKKTAKTAPVGVKVTKEFTFDLTPEESQKRLAAAGALHAEITKLDEEFKEVKAHWKSKIQTRTDARNEILVAGETGKEARVVDAIMVKDYTSKEIQYWVDGEVKESRTMTAEEMQMELGESRPRGKKQKLDSTANLSGMVATPTEGEEIGNVIKMETSKRTKHSAVDGARTETGAKE